MQWHTQTGDIANNIKVKVDFTLPALIAINAVTCNFHADESAKGGYDMILGQYLSSELWINLKFSDDFIEADDGTFKGSTTPLVDLGTYEF